MGVVPGEQFQKLRNVRPAISMFNNITASIQMKMRKVGQWHSLANNLNHKYPAYFTKDLSLCHKLKFSNPYILAT